MNTTAVKSVTDIKAVPEVLVKLQEIRKLIDSNVRYKSPVTSSDTLKEWSLAIGQCYVILSAANIQAEEKKDTVIALLKELDEACRMETEYRKLGTAKGNHCLFAIQVLRILISLCAELGLKLEEVRNAKPVDGSNPAKEGPFSGHGGCGPGVSN